MSITSAYFLIACSSYKIGANISAEERFKLGKVMYNNKDYEEAKIQFKLLTLNYPGSSFIDEAQYFLAQSYFKRKEYIFASDEFNRLLRLYPRSKWIDNSQFMVAMCDFKLSPKPTLDQKHTLQAVASFQRFLEDFPKSELAKEAERLLNICRTKLAEKDFRSGELYRKLKDYHASYVYFNGVVNSYYDTKFAHPALYWKSESLYRLGRKSEAEESFRELISKYPRSEFRAKSIARLKEIKMDLGQSQETEKKTSLSSQTKNELR